MNCPICNINLQPTDCFCPECGFEVHLLPNEISDEVLSYELERIRKYKERMQLMIEAKAEIRELTDQLSETTNRVEVAEEIIAVKTKEIEGFQKENNELQEQIKAHNVETPVAFLVVIKDEETLTGTINRRVIDIIPIHQGKNVFGKNPRAEVDAYSKRIVYCNEMQAEQFLIEGNTENCFLVQSISGNTYLRNRSNLLTNQKAELGDGDEIFIGNLMFVFFQTR